ncbi:SDR family oxidoreductase [Labrenzia sp. 011]|uniref:SDR family oxidoreductase n=1 Tax=Labrenzia sp. 011 TaxID=2171494 RepID=UPI000D51D0D0|nr:SDR family oxidoreductase [Labrenzia sp. 011]PVB63775.1 short chain dehydrogenase [Labrenzia sp. 011]
MDLKDKTVVITGAARGLGREMAREIAAHGAKLALLDLNEEGLQETVRLCAGTRGQAKAYPVDVTDETAVETVFGAIRKDLGAVEALVNNAGITNDDLLVKAKDGKILRKMSLAHFDKVIDVDLKAVFLCGREAAVQMIESGAGGVIVNISSISRAGNIGQSNYTAAKAGVAAMTVTWAKELARHNIRAACIAPGFCDTDMVAAIPPEIQNRITSMIPARRFGRPEEIARSVLFILENDYFNGRVLEVDGGMRL